MLTKAKTEEVNLRNNLFLIVFWCCERNNWWDRESVEIVELEVVKKYIL